MLDQLLNYISEQKLFRSGQRALLAVSGGIDSMAMVQLFLQTNFDFAIAHCNFQLRGKESDEDQLFVERVAAKNSIVCYTKHFDTEKYSKSSGISIQMAARDLRRAWFEEILNSKGFDVIATAHHLNDSMETMIFNIAKGTGISGLKGILPKKERYVRPLMFASREMIFSYAQANNIAWREDRSNSSIKYHRNLIRLKVLPELKKINPNLEETFSKSIKKIQASERIYRKVIENHRQKLIEKTNEGFRIEKEKLESIEEVEIVLYEILHEFGFNFFQIKDILLGVNRQSGKSFYSQDHQLVIDRQYLFISKLIESGIDEVFVDPDSLHLDLYKNRMTFKKIDPAEVKYSEDKNNVFFDFDSLEFPLKIRKWKHGDQFQPLGMKHKKKLSDFMIDEKIPLNLKNQVLVLISGENLVWVIGHRIDDRYKITKQTRMAYKIFNENIDDKSI